MMRQTHRHRPLRIKLRRSVGALLLLLGIFTSARIPLFYWRSWSVGSHLIHQVERAGPSWPHGIVAIVRIPAISLTAPVLQGTGDAQLNVAVGHLPASVDPGQPGTSILAAHNVTWFHRLNELRPGSLIIVQTPGHLWRFQVTGSRIVRVGSPVPNTRRPSLILEACYPLDALYLTPYRYLVFARLLRSIPTTRDVLRTSPSLIYHPIGIPPAVVAQGLTLATNDIPMGTLTIEGYPSPGWQASNAPLNAADSTTTLFLAAWHILRSRNLLGWNSLAPGVPNPAPSGLTVLRWVSALQETEWVHGGSVTATSAAIEASIETPSGPRLVIIRMATDVSRIGAMRLRQFAMVPL